MQIVEVYGAIKTACNKEAHLVADEDTGNLAVVVVQLLEDEPVSGGRFVSLVTSIH